MKFNFMVIVCSFFLSLSSMAAEIFFSNIGKYKIESCQLTENGNQLEADSWCTDYSEINLSKDNKGILILQFITIFGGSFSFPIEIFNRSEGNYKNTSEYNEYGDFHIWNHSQSYLNGTLSHIHNMRSFAFNKNSKNQITFIISQSEYVNGIKQNKLTHEYLVQKQSK